MAIQIFIKKKKTTYLYIAAERVYIYILSLGLCDIFPNNKKKLSVSEVNRKNPWALFPIQSFLYIYIYIRRGRFLLSMFFFSVNKKEEEIALCREPVIRGNAFFDKKKKKERHRHTQTIACSAALPVWFNSRKIFFLSSRGYSIFFLYIYAPQREKEIKIEMTCVSRLNAYYYYYHHFFFVAPQERISLQE